MPCEVISISRLDAKDQQSVGRFNQAEEARQWIEERRQSEPLRYFVLFAQVSAKTRIATYHTL
jgi:hypothetical protein